MWLLVEDIWISLVQKSIGLNLEAKKEESKLSMKIFLSKKYKPTKIDTLMLKQNLENFHQLKSWSQSMIISRVKVWERTEMVL